MLEVFRKIAKVHKSKWSTLSTGEKALKVVLIALEIGLVLALGILAVVVILSFWVASEIRNGWIDAANSCYYKGTDKYHWY